VVTNDTTIQIKSILLKNTNQDKANGAKKKHRADSSQTAPVAGLKKLKKHISPSDAAFVAEKPKPKKKRRPVDISVDQGRVRGVMEDLVNAQVVANAAEVESFGLSETELMVNDKKQPAELQRKLMETYGIKHSYGLYYGPVKMGGKGVILDKGDL
jgi:hypothetical protein